MHNVPAGWDLLRVGEVGEVKLGRQRSPEHASGPHMRPYLRVANVFDGRIDYSDVLKMNFSSSEFATYSLKSGDILLNEGQSLDLVGRSALYDGPSGICFQNTLIRFRSYRAVPGFARSLFKYWMDRGEFRKIAKQTTSIAHLGVDRFAKMGFPFPPVGEQRKIAEIFDVIDSKINASRHLISKLQVIRLAQLRIAVEPSLRLLRSVEASELASVAKSRNRGWKVVPVKSTLLGIDAGNSPDLEDTPAVAEEWGVLKVSAVKRDGFKPLENKVARNPALFNSDLCVRAGDLLITRANTADLVGLTCVVDETPPHLMLCDKTLRLKVNQRLTSVEYIHLVLGLAEVRRQIEIAATGTSASMKNISQESIKRLVIPWGESAEMSRIVEVDAAFKVEIEALRKEEGRLQLLKQGLMNDLLTGRVRVKDVENAL